MWKKWLCFLLSSILLLSGCSVQSDPHKDGDKTELTWVMPAMWNQKQQEGREDALNAALEEKGYPYHITLDVISPEAYFQTCLSYAEERKPVDLMFYGSALSDEIIALHHFYYSGLVLPLQSYLETDTGYQLKEIYPQIIWDASQINGDVFGIPSPFVPPAAPITILWDRTLAEKYDVHPENWTDLPHHYEDEIQKVASGEAKSSDFYAISNARSLEYVFPTHTRIISNAPFYIDETAEDLTVLHRAEIPELPDITRFLDNLEKKGYLSDTLGGKNTRYFLYVLTYRSSEQELERRFGPDFADRYGVIRIGEPRLTRANMGFFTSIASWSSHPDEAFQLLAAVYTDPELSNLLAWGIPNTDYTVEDGRAVSNTGFSETVGGNLWITYPGSIDVLDKKAVFEEAYTHAVPSKILTFCYDLSDFYLDSSYSIEGTATQDMKLKQSLQKELDQWIAKEDTP